MATDTDDAATVTPDAEETTVWRVLKRVDDHVYPGKPVTRWDELGTIEDRWPDASDIGEAFGEGDYLIWERDSKYSFHSLRPMSVVADKRWRERTEDEA